MRKRHDQETVSSVVELERVTGIASATLRVWERRYGFPRPARDSRGRRTYDAPQVAKLRLIGQLLARGERPGRLVTQSSGELQCRLLVAQSRRPTVRDPLLDLLRALDHAGVMQHLLQQLITRGLEQFVLEVVAPGNVAVGAAWACGELEPHEEHLYTECVQQVLRASMVGLPAMPADSRPRVLLATPLNERHGLGILMVQALLMHNRCVCLPLGLGLAAGQVAAAARTWRTDLVAISSTRAVSTRDVLLYFRELRAALSPGVEVWAGGSNQALASDEIAKLDGVQVFEDLPAVLIALTRYRSKA